MLGACRDLERFSTAPGEAYCGAMVSAPAFHEGFVRDGAPPVLRLRLELNTDQLTTFPGTLNSDDAARGLCSATEEPLFADAPLHAVPDLVHDPLSLAEFGDGREHNFFAYVDSACLGTLLAVVSLMQNDDVEVRLFKPTPATQIEGDARARPGFAVFQLRRQPVEDCGF